MLSLALWLCEGYGFEASAFSLSSQSLLLCSNLSEVINNVDEVHPIGVFAQIVEIQHCKGGHLNVLLAAHRRLVFARSTNISLALLHLLCSLFPSPVSSDAYTGVSLESFSASIHCRNHKCSVRNFQKSPWKQCLVAQINSLVLVARATWAKHGVQA